MIKKLKHRNNKRLKDKFKSFKESDYKKIHEFNVPSFSAIDKVKLLGQKYYQQRLKRQQKMNPRQLKKLRKQQLKSSLAGSKLSGICKIKLRPATARFSREN